MTGPETSNAGGGFDLLRRATQAMMSRFVTLISSVDLSSPSFCFGSVLLCFALRCAVCYCYCLSKMIIFSSRLFGTLDIETLGSSAMLASLAGWWQGPSPNIASGGGGDDDGRRPCSTQAQQLQRRLLESTFYSG
ncbi:hypothetical protein FAVG1_01933 [Fusarium avenaceum]|nr:hypothetical protein FAVG1_01933 [Fusarium avenaceum]